MSIPLSVAVKLAAFVGVAVAIAIAEVASVADIADAGLHDHYGREAGGRGHDKF